MIFLRVVVEHADERERLYTLRGMASQNIQFLKSHAFKEVEHPRPSEPHGALECAFSASAPGCGVRIICDPSVPDDEVRIDPAKPDEVRVGPDAFLALTTLPEAQKVKIPVCRTGSTRSRD
jgi:hypothetical protein